MQTYSAEKAKEELEDLESLLVERAEKLSQKRDSYELARMLVVVNKEIYRIEEEARRLRLTGELNPDLYKTMISGYNRIRYNVLKTAGESGIGEPVVKLFRALRFSSDVAGVYLGEYVKEFYGERNEGLLR